MKWFANEKAGIACLVLLGTALHVYWSFKFSYWMQAPDQVAWGAELDELVRNGTISYKQLIHYPHEGGSFFISLLALCFYPLKGLLPPLVLAALVVDTVVRYVQARVTTVVFGAKAGFLFASFGIFLLPSLLPWVFVNFGLHACSAVFPFLLLYFAVAGKDKERSAVYCGLLTGIAISFAFDNIVLFPAYLVFLIVSFRGQRVMGKRILQYVGFTLLGLVPYLACRLFIPQQFAFEPSGLLQGRDLILDVHFSPEQLAHLYEVWYNSFAASFFLSASSWFSPRMHTVIAMIVMLFAMFLLVRDKKKETVVMLAVFVVLCFIFVYSLSPLYEDSIEHTGYVVYRHFSYILPLVMLLILRGFLSLPKAGIWVSKCWIFVCALFTLSSISHTNFGQWPSYKSAGWILAKKYGDDPQKLIQVAGTREKAARDELMYGFGWGISAALLQHTKAPATEEIKTIRSLLGQFPAEDRKQLKEGIVFSFSEQMTPQLDKAIYDPLMKELEK